MDNEALRQYVTDQRNMGISDEALFQNLVSNGWPAETVRTVLGIDGTNAHTTSP
jgi:hypothetical protein